MTFLLICDLLNSPLNNSVYKLSNCRINNELERISREVVVALFEVLSCNLSRGIQNQRFVTMFTITLHRLVSSATWIQSTSSKPISQKKIYSISQSKFRKHFTCHASPILLFGVPNKISQRVKKFLVSSICKCRTSGKLGGPRNRFTCIGEDEDSAFRESNPPSIILYPATYVTGCPS